MILNQLIAILLPNIIGYRQCNNIFNIEKTFSKRLEIFFMVVLFTNLITYSFVVFVLRTKGFEFTNQFTIKYILLSSVISYILPIVCKFWQSKFKINIVVKNNEQK